jgi:hypothetical protein
MKYPISHNKRFEEIEAVVSTWPVEKNFDHVLKWLMQFDTEDIDLGVRVIKNLNVVGFEDLNTSLSIAYSKPERVEMDKGSKISSQNTLFAGIGDGAKSGAMIGYNFRIANEIPEDNFMTEESIEHLEGGLIENIVLVDDVIGTGDQATREIKQLTDKVTPFGVKNIFLLTAVGMTDGIKNIIADTKAHVFSAFEYSNLDTATNLDSAFYDGVPHEHREKLRSRIEYYGRVSNKAGLGYGGIGALIAFYYNTPNISLPIVWGSKNSWIPLFKRAVKINGISSYYKQIESSISKKKKSNSPIQRTQKELLLFVEGRLDEAFFEFVMSGIGNNGFDKVIVISLGGYRSKTLIENITRLSPNCVFLIEDDDDEAPAGFVDRYRNNIGDHQFLMVKPAQHYLDIDRLSQDERWGRLFQRPTNLEGARRPIFMRRPLLEIQRQLGNQASSLHDFFQTFVASEKLTLLQKQLKAKFIELAATG